MTFFHGMTRPMSSNCLGRIGWHVSFCGTFMRWIVIIVLPCGYTCRVTFFQFLNPEMLLTTFSPFSQRMILECLSRLQNTFQKISCLWLRHSHETFHEEVLSKRCNIFGSGSRMRNTKSSGKCFWSDCPDSKMTSHETFNEEILSKRCDVFGCDNPMRN